MNEIKIIVTGANGQLGIEFKKNVKNDPRFHFYDRDQLDICDVNALRSVVQSIKPNIIINCAAYTAVDRAEDETSKAFLINDSAVANIGSVAAEVDCKVIHFSTDYVYHIIKDDPLIESDQCQPQSVYGMSKRAGELSLSSQTDNYLIFRVSWLYSAQKNNFVKTMLRLGQDRDQLSIVNDQIGAPTSAKDLVSSILHIIEQHPDATGIYNYCNSGKTNWCEFAQEIFRVANITCVVSGLSTKEYGARAPRPLWSIMSTDKLLVDYGIIIPPWRQSLKECLEELKAIA